MSLLRRFGLTGLLLTIFFITSVFIFFNASIQKPWREQFLPPERKILSVAFGRALPGHDVRVAKVQAREGLFIEVYGPVENGLEPLIDRIKLPDRRDGQFQFQGRATNLALQDLNGDQVFEIIAPTYDDSLVPHLNIYYYNKATGHFEVFER
jgi:hypothetical protein